VLLKKYGLRGARGIGYRFITANCEVTQTAESEFRSGTLKATA